MTGTSQGLPPLHHSDDAGDDAAQKERQTDGAREQADRERPAALLETTIALAMHGTNSVIVTMATSSWAEVRFIEKNPAAPKSRRTKPITNAVAASAGSPSHPMMSGEATRMIQSRAPVTCRIEMNAAPASEEDRDLLHEAPDLHAALAHDVVEAWKAKRRQVDEQVRRLAGHDAVQHRAQRDEHANRMAR